jgi:hypothetical protein
MMGGIYNSSQIRGYIETDNIKSVLLKAHRDFTNSWNLIHPSIIQFMASCKPAWLLNIINESMKELNVPYKPSNNMGSDHLLFAYAGIPSTNITVAGTNTNSPDDNVDNINTNSLEKAGKIVAAIVMNTMNN